MMFYTQQRKAFSMLTAVVVIVTMAVIAAFVTNISGKTIKITTDQYRKEQAILYARSYTEYAIMAVSADPRAGAAASDTAIRTITANIGQNITANSGTGTGYRVRVQIFYIGNSTVNINTVAGNRQLSAIVNNNDTPLNIIIDAYVDYRDVNDINKVLTYHRRSLQKI